MEGRPVSASRVVMSRTMQPADANYLGNVHGGVIMRLMDEAAGTAAARHCRRPVVTAAIESRCDVLFTEDLQSGRRYGKLEIVNPFRLGAHEATTAAPLPRRTRPRRPVASRSQRL